MPQRLVVGDAVGPRRKGLRKRLTGIVQQADRSPPHGGRIGAAVRLGPDHAHAGSALHRRQPRRRGPGGVPCGRGQDRSCERLVDGPPAREALGELRPVDCERPVGPRRPLPGNVLVDVTPHRQVGGERAAYGLALDRAAPERDH